MGRTVTPWVWLWGGGGHETWEPCFPHLGWIRITRRKGPAHTQIAGPTPRVSDSVGLGRDLECAFLTDSQVMLILLAQRPHLEKHHSRFERRHGKLKSVPSQDPWPWPMTLKFQHSGTQHIVMMVPRRGELISFPAVLPLSCESVSLKCLSFLIASSKTLQGTLLLILRCVWPSFTISHTCKEMELWWVTCVQVSNPEVLPYPFQTPSLMPQAPTSYRNCQPQWPPSLPMQWENEITSLPTNTAYDFPRVKSKTNCLSLVSW